MQSSEVSDVFGMYQVRISTVAELFRGFLQYNAFKEISRHCLELGTTTLNPHFLQRLYTNIVSGHLETDDYALVIHKPRTSKAEAVCVVVMVRS
jgi:hypothetical protein